METSRAGHGQESSSKETGKVDDFGAAVIRPNLGRGIFATKNAPSHALMAMPDANPIPYLAPD